jgi:arylsulfatase K
MNWLYGFSDETVRLVRRIYFAMIAETDAMVGEILNALKESGVADSTYVIFASDHGELAMEHRSYFKMAMYEAAVRIPMIIRGPGVGEGRREDGLVSLVDIYPTLMDMAGIPRPEGLDGFSMMPELAGAPTGHPGWVFSQYHDCFCNTGLFMVRRGEWKYIAYPGFRPQLFNLAEDPDELRDLAGKEPRKITEMDALLRGIVDYKAVDRKVKAYDRASFKKWREECLAAGDYGELMSRVFSGWDYIAEGEGAPWTDEDERVIEKWLEKRVEA